MSRNEFRMSENAIGRDREYIELCFLNKLINFGLYRKHNKIGSNPTQFYK